MAESETADRASGKGAIDATRAEAIEYYKKMLLIRRFEERAEEAYGHGKIGGFLHLYIGEEAIAVGALAALRPDDDLVTHYRDHGYVLARGVDPKAVMAELYGKRTGVSKGKGGSMHLADVEKHLWGGYAIVGGHVPLATGLALANQYKREPRVVACFMGDGATNIGAFYAGLNMAAIWKVPLLAIVENNRYGMGTPVSRASAVVDVHRKADAFGIPGIRVDGNDILAVRDAVREAAEGARAGEGPVLLEMITYRFKGHSMGDPQRYRKKEEVERAKLRDPIVTWKNVVLKSFPGTENELEEVAREVEAVVDEAVRFAEESPNPDEADLCSDVLSDERFDVLFKERKSHGPENVS